MVTAVNSNTGSEYDIIEKHYCKSDVPYREMTKYLKRKGITDATYSAIIAAFFSLEIILISSL
ncbi:MAG: hypothetical protein IIW68_01955, partial [Lachnospiraceae bacterium]|nr:hypothetical protein [Lachnospiraceae bacterium]